MRHFGSYELMAGLGGSDFGSLWASRLAGRTGRERNRQVVLVRLVRSQSRSDAFAARQLRRAAAWAKDIAHDNVLSLIECVADGAELGLVSAYESTAPLRSILRIASVERLSGRRATPIPVPVALHIALDLLEAVALLERHTAHRSDTPKFVWGGLGPDNVLVGADGRSRLLELGISGVLRRSEPWASHPKRIAYAAPETLRKSASDVRSDLFSIGVMLWELLLNTPLFSGINTAEVIASVCSQKIPRAHTVRPGGDLISSQLGEVVARALARDPAERFQSADAMADAIWDAGHAIANTKRTVTVIDELCGERLEREQRRIDQAVATAEERTPTEPAPGIDRLRARQAARRRRDGTSRSLRRAETLSSPILLSSAPPSLAAAIVEPERSSQAAEDESAEWSETTTLQPEDAPRTSSAVPTLRPAIRRAAKPAKTTRVKWPPLRSFAPSRPLRMPARFSTLPAGGLAAAADRRSPAQLISAEPAVEPPSPTDELSSPEPIELDAEATQEFRRSHLAAAATADTPAPRPELRSGPRSSGTLEPRVSNVPLDDVAAAPAGGSHRPNGWLTANWRRSAPLRWSALSAAATACVLLGVTVAVLAGAHQSSAAGPPSGAAAPLEQVPIPSSRAATDELQTASPAVTDEIPTIQGERTLDPVDEDDTEPDAEKAQSRSRTRKPAKGPAKKQLRRRHQERFVPTDI